MSWPGQASEHDADHSEANEGGGGLGITLEIACQPAVMADPGERAFDNPAFGQDDEAMQRVALDDFQFPATRLGDDGRRLRSLIAGIGEDALDKGKQAAGAPVEHPSGAIAILDVGGMDDNVQEQAERVDQDVALAAGNFLARIKPLRVHRGAPF